MNMLDQVHNATKAFVKVQEESTFRWGDLVLEPGMNGQSIKLRNKSGTVFLSEREAHHIMEGLQIMLAEVKSASRN